MIAPNSEEYRLLYTDDFGDDVGLDEVQLLDPPPVERIPALVKMMGSPNTFLSYQALLVLTAWGEDSALSKLEEFIDQNKISSFEFAPNRLTGEDNLYDELSYAIHLYGLSGGDPNNALKLFKKLLAIYPKYFFESKLKHALLKSNFKELAPLIEKAFKETLANGRKYQASQLLPVLAKFSSESGLEIIKSFDLSSEDIPDPLVNVAEALRYCLATEEANRLLQKLKNSRNPNVSREANISYEYLFGK